MFWKWNSVVLLCLSTVILIALQIKLFGWLLLALSVGSLIFLPKQLRRDLLLINISIAILGLIPITTDISYSHMFIMGSGLVLAVGIPYFFSKYVFKDNMVKFKFHHGRSWYKSEIGYIALTALVAYFLIPFYLKNTGAYLNWGVELNPSSLLRFFVGTNGLGIWDELFFISTVFGILRRYFVFWAANIIQAVLFTSFLYELGFTGWGYIMIFIFALIQGIIFKKTESLFYVITIHLTLDFILFLAIINAHYPHIANVFIFK